MPNKSEIEIIKTIIDDWGDLPQSGICIEIFKSISSMKEDVERLTFQSINIFTNRKHKTEHLLEALQYLSGSRVHILDVVFQLLDDSGEFINLKNKDVKDARYTGVLINPNTGEQVDNFEQKVHMVFAPNLSELKKHYG